MTESFLRNLYLGYSVHQINLNEEKQLQWIGATLKGYFPQAKAPVHYDPIQHAAPLLIKITTDRELANQLRRDYSLELDSDRALTDLATICRQFREKGILRLSADLSADGRRTLTPANPYYYRLPLLISEYPRHTQAINEAIQAFNQLIEAYHAQASGSKHSDAKDLNTKELEVKDLDVKQEDLDAKQLEPQPADTKQLEPQSSDAKKDLDAEALNQCFLKIIQSLEENILKHIENLKKNDHCLPELLSDLLLMMNGWLAEPIAWVKPKDLDVVNDSLDEQKTKIASEKNKKRDKKKSEEQKITLSSTSPPTSADDKKPRAEEKTSPKNRPLEIKVVESQEPNRTTSRAFSQQNSYRINSAGLLDRETQSIVLNAFGLKFGGHLDALTTRTPHLIPFREFYNSFCRELSQAMEIPQNAGDKSDQFQLILKNTLCDCGMRLIKPEIKLTDESKSLNELYIDPFCEEPQTFLSPTRIKTHLENHTQEAEISLTNSQLSTLSIYLSRILHRMQFNPGIALGIGANDDGTVSLSNDAGAHFFQFSPADAEWASRFSQLSLHRQGPAQAKMNAAIGVQYELCSAFVNEFSKMSQLQSSEYRETIYNAIIDSLVTKLFPHPDFFPNLDYKKYRKSYILAKDASGLTKLRSYTEESTTGIFKDEKSLVPKHRRAGTIDVQALPKDHGASFGSCLNSYQGNPLVAQQLQYVQAMQGGNRGDLAYNPIGPDSFITDLANGQMIKNDDGSYLPLIGVIPKNFDKYFKQEKELCASFVIRMMHSARLKAFCPTFRETLNRIKINFLPNSAAIPDLPRSLLNSQFKSIWKLKPGTEAVERKDVISLIPDEKGNLCAYWYENDKLISHFISADNVSELNKLFIRSSHSNKGDEHFNQIIALCNRPPSFLQRELKALKDSLDRNHESLNYQESERLFCSLFKNIVYGLRKNNADPLFLNFHYQLIRDPEFLRVMSREHFEKVMRLLKINPCTIEGVVDPDYQQTIDYLGLLIEKFYPQPSAETATKIQKYAKAYAYSPTFLRHKHIVNYFNSMKQLKQMNLSRKQSPGMVFGALKHNGDATWSRIGDIYGMHRDNFLSGYRDPEGNMAIPPETGHRVLDKIVKSVAVFSALMQHDDNPLKQLYKPFVRTYEAYHYMTSRFDAKSKVFFTGGMLSPVGLPALILAFMGGAIEGGIKAVGLSLKLLFWRPVEYIGKKIGFINSKKKEEKLEHALSIPATPANDPGYKVKMSNKLRDMILHQAPVKPEEQKSFISTLQEYMVEIMTTTHKGLSEEEVKGIAGILIPNQILTDEEWQQFSQPFAGIDSIDQSINTMLCEHQVNINNALISAVHYCFLTEDSLTEDTVEQIAETHKLNRSQIKLMESLIKVFNSSVDAKKSKLLLLFSEEGEGSLKSRLKIRDQHSQKLHDAVVQAFNLGRVLDKLETDNSSDKTNIEAFQEEITALEDEMQVYTDNEEKEKDQIRENQTEIQSNIQLLEEKITCREVLISRLLQHIDRANASSTVPVSTLEEKSTAMIHIPSTAVDDKLAIINIKDICDEYKKKFIKFLKSLNVRIINREILEIYQQEISDLCSHLIEANYGAIEIYRILKSHQDKFRLKAVHVSSCLDKINQETIDLLKKSDAKPFATHHYSHPTKEAENKTLMSIKDQAYSKWKHFAYRSLNHQLLPREEIAAIFKHFDDYAASNINVNNDRLCDINAAKLRDNLIEFKQATSTLVQAFQQSLQPKYQKIIINGVIDTFYRAYCRLKITPGLPENLRLMLNDFVNVTMNAVVNAKLDTMLPNALDNPLDDSVAIGFWLRSIYQKQEDFRSLLAQQNEQAGLERAIWRRTLIIMRLEKSLGIVSRDETTTRIKKGDSRIRKTGLQGLLRTYMEPKEQIDNDGNISHRTKVTDEKLRKLCSQSPTLFRAVQRVKEKVTVNEIQLGSFLDRDEKPSTPPSDKGSSSSMNKN